MRFIILLTTFLGGALTMGDPFLQFSKEHGKNYSTRAELDHRRAIFEKNFLDMVEHNAKFEIGEVSWHRKVTPDYDLTKEEFASLRLRQTHPHTSIKSKDRIPQVFQDKLNEVKSLPSSWNWVNEGGVSSVKNQGDCGSCSAFAATALVESCFWQASGHLYDDLSEQFLVDCAYGHELTDNGYTDGAWGCDGAWTPVYWDWMIKHSEGKHQRESNYGYEAANHNCRAHSDGYYPRATVSDYAITYSPNQHTIQKWVHISPVGTSIDASHLGDYDHGVFDDSRCCESSSDPDCWWENNHDVTVVGYGTENGHDYWLVKNSWGSHFGEDGYFKIKRGKGICGFAGYGIEAATCNAA